MNSAWLQLLELRLCREGREGLVSLLGSSSLPRAIWDERSRCLAHPPELRPGAASSQEGGFGQGLGEEEEMVAVDGNTGEGWQPWF